VCYWSRLKKLGGSWKRKLQGNGAGSVSGRLYDHVQR
jgi:hypothetical protein